MTDKNYTIQEAKNMLHDVVMEESKNLENHLKLQDKKKNQVSV